MSTVPRSSISLTFSTFSDSIACNNRAPFFCRVSNFGLFQFRGLQKVSDYLPINLLKPFIELLLHNGNLGGVHPRTWAAGAQDSECCSQCWLPTPMTSERSPKFFLEKQFSETELAAVAQLKLVALIGRAYSGFRLLSIRFWVQN